MNTVTLPQTVAQSTTLGEALDAVKIIGKLVVRNGQTYKVNSVEGRDWYAFNRDGETVLDLGFTPLDSYTEPVLTIIPTFAEMGQGFGENAYLSQVRPGVSLIKRWA